jgi:hypothetical protein
MKNKLQIPPALLTPEECNFILTNLQNGRVRVKDGWIKYVIPVPDSSHMLILNAKNDGHYVVESVERISPLDDDIPF